MRRGAIRLELRGYPRRAALVFGCAAGLVAGCGAAPVRPLPPRDLPAEIRRLEGQVASLSTERPAVHLALARLYLDAANPSPDYLAALAELRFFAALDPKGGAEPEVRQWIGALEVLARAREDRDRLAARLEDVTKESAEARKRLSSLRRENQELGRAAEGQTREEAGLRDAVRSLTRENQELKKQIEELKALDRQLEILRKNVR